MQWLVGAIQSLVQLHIIGCVYQTSPVSDMCVPVRRMMLTKFVYVAHTWLSFVSLADAVVETS